MVQFLVRMAQLPQKANDNIRIIFGIIGVVIFIIGIYAGYYILVSMVVWQQPWHVFSDYFSLSWNIMWFGIVMLGFFIDILMAILIINTLNIAYAFTISAIQDKSPKEIWHGWLGGRVVRYCLVGLIISAFGIPILGMLIDRYEEFNPYVGTSVHYDPMNLSNGWLFSLWDLSMTDKIKVDCILKENNPRDYYDSTLINSSYGWKFAVLDIRIFNYLNEALVFEAKGIKDKDGMKYYEIQDVYSGCKKCEDDYYNIDDKYGRIILSKDKRAKHGFMNGSDYFYIVYKLPTTSVPDEFYYDIHPENYSHLNYSRSGSIYLGKSQKHII